MTTVLVAGLALALVRDLHLVLALAQGLDLEPVPARVSAVHQSQREERHDDCLLRPTQYHPPVSITNSFEVSTGTPPQCVYAHCVHPHRPLPVPRVLINY